jgi:hypothetical protein
LGETFENVRSILVEYCLRHIEKILSAKAHISVDEALFDCVDAEDEMSEVFG